MLGGSRRIWRVLQDADHERQKEPSEVFSDKASLQEKYPKLKHEDLKLIYKKIGKSLGLRVNRLDEATKW